VETVISNLVTRYERGSLSRRELIQGLAVLAAAGTAETASAATPFQANSINHISLQTKDLDGTVKFYQDVFGLPIFNEDRRISTVRLKIGSGRLAIRGVEPSGIVDHIAFGVDSFDKTAATEKLKQLGVTPTDTGEPLGFHVTDPNGYPIQIMPTEAKS